MASVHSGLLTRPWLRYSVAVAAVLGGFLLRRAITAYVGEGLPTYITFYPAVMVAALLGGRGPGLLATALAVAAVDAWVVTPQAAFWQGHPAEAAGVVLFALMGVFLSGLTDLYLRAREKAAAYDRTLELRENQQALRERTDELTAVLDALPAYVWMGHDPDCRLITGNLAASEMAGVAAGSNVSQSVAAKGEGAYLRQLKADGSDYQPEELPMQQAIATGKTVRDAYVEFRFADGRRVETLGNAAPLFDAAGRIRGAVAAFLDITERKEAEAALLASERRFRQVTESLPQLVWTCAADGPCDYLSPQWVQYTGRNAAEQLGYGWLEQLHPDDRQRVIDHWQATAAKGENFEIEFRIRRHDGVYRWFRTLAVLLRDEAGKVVKWFGSNTDIDDIKRAEDALRESEQRIQQALRVSHSFTFEWQPETDQVLRSDSCALILGLGGEDICHDTGQRFFQRVHPEDRARFLQVLGKLTPASPSYATEYRVVRGDGSEAVLEETGQGSFDAAGRLQRLVGVATDITERKQAEATLRRSRDRQELVSRLVGTLLTAADPQTVIQQLCDEVRVFLDCDVFFNYLLEAGAGRLRFNACGGVAPRVARKVEALELGASLCGTSAREGCRVLAEHLADSDDPRSALVRSLGIRAYACHPLLGSDGVTIGTLSFGTRSRAQFSPEDLALMKTVADHVAVALHRRRAAEALQKSEERLQLAQHAAGVGVWDWDMRTGSFEWSAELFRLFGLEPDPKRATFETWRSVVHPADQQLAEERIESAIRSRAPLVSEYRIVRAGGELRWIRALGNAYYDAAGKPQRMSGICLDTTVYRKTEEALRESELFYRQTLESIPGMVFTTRPDGYCDYQSQQWAEFTGVPMSEHLGDGWNKLLHPDDQPRAYAAWRAAVEGRAPYDLEYRVRRHDGQYEWFKVRGRPIRDAEGRIVRWFGVALSIEDLKRAEERLRQSENRYAMAQRAANIGSWEWDITTDGLVWSEEIEPMFGFAAGQFPGTNAAFLECVHPDDRPGLVAAVNAAVDGRGHYAIEHRIVRPDGTVRWVAEQAEVHRDPNGRPQRMLGIVQDITSRKEAEERRTASLREKEVLLQEIHHRVKNNLQVISSLISLQSDALTEPALREALDDVRDRVRTMALVHEKLYESHDLARLNFADYAASLLQYLWSAHRTAATVRLTLALDAAALPVVVAIPCGLILNELASNALKHAFRDRAEGEVTAGFAVDPVSHRACLWVQDNGVGLGAGFDWRQSRSLGLRLVQMLAQQLHGTIETTSGPGTEFRVTFEVPSKV